MKTIIALLLTCLPLCAATLYPVLTDSSARTFPGGVTNFPFLNSNSVFTGTIRVTGAATLTNAGSVFAGDGSGLTGVTATVTGYVTNNGGGLTNGFLSGGTVAGMTNSDLTASRVMVSGATGIPTNSSVTSATLLFLDATSSVQTQLDSKPTIALTNVATLDGAQTVTGAKNFTAAQTITNAASTISGNGAGLTNLAAGNIASGSLADGRLSSNVPLKDAANTFTGQNTFPTSLFTLNKINRRTLFSTNNIFVSAAGVIAYTPTNQGDYAICGQIVQVTLPALLSTNSVIRCGVGNSRTNANSTAASYMGYVGSQTNAVWLPALNLIATSIGANWNTMQPAGIVFKNMGSFTSQRVFPSGSWPGGLADERNLYPSNYVDTSTSWNFYLGIWTSTSCTNVIIDSLWIEEEIID